MGNIDSLPGFSQVKSLVQASAGDSKGARITQENFVRGCPVISQVTSAVQAIQGDTKAAKDTQKYFAKNLSNVADGIPVVGHIKGGIHYACGDNKGGDSAMIAASRTFGVIAGGVGGVLLGGPVGAIAGGIAVGAAMYGITTGVDTAVKGEFIPHGHVALGHKAANGTMYAGTAFDWAMMPVFDGLAGKAYSKVYQKIRSRFLVNKNLKSAIKNAVEAGEITLHEGETVSGLVDQLKAAASDLRKTMNEADAGALGERSVASVVIDIEGNKHTSYSFQLRKAANIDAFGNEVPSAVQVLDNRFKGAAPRIRGNNQGQPQPQCAEIHGLHQHHRANGLTANPAKTITVMQDGTGIKAVARCANCKKIGKYVNMGQVPTDILNGISISVDGNMLNTAVDLLQGLDCNCEDHKK